MGLPLSPGIIAGAYEFLRMTPPFRGWKLPQAAEVEFVVSRHRNHVAYHRGRRRKVRSHEIGVSEVCVGHTNTLLRAMAHEMIHQYQQRARTETPHTEHNAEFLRLARLVCRYHGWDEKEFL
ncbi:MAG: SprT-like domain-containing protein [Alphaproteobacteria bacterium]|nr:SprT-like domain-containing protein [Alphaproteobacteria bacterium]